MNYFDETLFLKRANELFGQSSQKEICSKTGLGQSTISNIQNNKPKNSSILLHQIQKNQAHQI